MATLKLITGIAALGVLAACASAPAALDRSSQVSAYDVARAGAPVATFRLANGVNGWNAVAEDKLVITTGAADAYLLTLDETCMNLEFAHRIGVTTSMGNWVQRGFDYVRFDDGFVGQRCRITEIRPLDYAPDAD